MIKILSPRVLNLSATESPPILLLRRGERSCRACAALRKMGGVKLSMFNKIHHTFLSNPVKTKKSPRLFRDNGALENIWGRMRTAIDKSVN